LVVLNTLLPVLARTGVYCSVIAEGETYGTNALSFDAFAATTLGVLKKMGLYAFPTQTVAGFGRESRGEVLLDVEPSSIQGVELTSRGLLKELGGVVATSRLSASVAERAISHLHNLARGSDVPLTIEHTDTESIAPGCHVTLWAHYERGFGGAAVMGAKSVRVEALAQNAFDELLDWMRGEACVDPYIADQILVPCVIAEGPSTFSVSRLTQRLLTCVWVVKQFTPIHITVRGSENKPGTVTIRH
jgi:RNA 3'-terminal phosphate cyclase (ATP)